MLSGMEPTRSVRPFEVISEYEPSGDQPHAIDAACLEPYQCRRNRRSVAGRDRYRQISNDGLVD